MLVGLVVTTRDPYQDAMAGYLGALLIGLAVGVDYSFPVLQTLVVGAQYYRNGSGATDPDDYGVVSRTSQGIEPPYREFASRRDGMIHAMDGGLFMAAPPTVTQ